MFNTIGVALYCVLGACPVSMAGTRHENSSPWLDELTYQHMAYPASTSVLSTNYFRFRSVPGFIDHFTWGLATAIYVAMVTPILYDNSYSLNDSNLKYESYWPHGWFFKNCQTLAFKYWVLWCRAKSCGAKHFGEQPCNLEVAVQLTLEASTCVLYLSLILGIDRILLCLI